MTIVTTYGKHGLQDDCNRLTGLPLGNWTETDSGGLMTPAIYYDDYFFFTRTAGASEAYMSYPDEAGANNLSLSSDIYTTLFWRYKTDNSNIKAKIVLVFSVGDPQIILPETSSLGMTAGYATITADQTIDHIRLYANAAAGTVVYDMAMITKKPFPLPNYNHLIFNPPPRYADIGIPSRRTDVTQALGDESATLDIQCDLLTGKWKRLIADGYAWNDDLDAGQVFYELGMWGDAWQWIDTGFHQFKVTPRQTIFNYREDERTVDLLLKEYSRCNKDSLPEAYWERFGLNL